MSLLYIEASPRGDTSISASLAREFVATFGNLSTDELLLWREPMPELAGPLIHAKYARLAQAPFDPEQAAAWQAVAAMVERLGAAREIVIATPMWNFGIPYKLKHWIDLVTQPGLTFRFDPQEGYRPLLTPRPVTIVLASAGDYADGPSWGRPDLASPYLDAALRFIGLGTPTIVRVGPTAEPSAAREAAVERARAELGSLVTRRTNAS